jgi:hypothetical protein
VSPVEVLVNDGWRMGRREVVDSIRWCSCGASFRFCGGRRIGGSATAHPFVIKGLQDPFPEALLELEQDLDAREVDPPVPGQMPDPLDPADVLVAVEADVRRCPGRTEQPLIFVDPQCPRMHRDNPGGDADDVYRPPRIAICLAKTHVETRC